MTEREKGRGLTAGERLTSVLLALAPWLTFALIGLLPAVYFFLIYLAAAEGAGEYLLLAMTSLGVGAAAALFAAAVSFFLRRGWEARLRERLARDGVTAPELKWFLREVSAERRRALKGMERTSPLLAEAYRDTLAADVTAARVLANARRESAEVARRLASAARAAGAGRAELVRDLEKDQARVERVLRETAEHRHEIETRLQAIEAMASRDVSERETEIALRRLGSVREHAPLGLSAAREESDAREEVEREMRGPRSPGPGEGGQSPSDSARASKSES